MVLKLGVQTEIFRVWYFSMETAYWIGRCLFFKHKLEEAIIPVRIAIFLFTLRQFHDYFIYLLTDCTWVENTEINQNQKIIENLMIPKIYTVNVVISKIGLIYQ